MIWQIINLTQNFMFSAISFLSFFLKERKHLPYISRDFKPKSSFSRSPFNEMWFYVQTIFNGVLLFANVINTLISSHMMTRQVIKWATFVFANLIIFIFLNEKEERKQRGKLEELKHLCSLISAFSLSSRSKLLILYG